MMLETCAPGGTDRCKESKPVWRGPANSAVVIPAWVRYLWLEDAADDDLSIPLLDHFDGTPVRYWRLGQVLPVRGGCGGGETLWLDGSGDQIISMWGTSSRQEAYESSVRAIP
jgi:hypothetical protein